MIDRRQLLRGGMIAAGAAALPAPLLGAGRSPADWTLALTDVPSDIAPRALTRLHGRAPGLHGTLYRNGPARFRRGASSVGHWFDGDGLVRAWRIDGPSASLAARFVDTPKRRLEERLGRIVQPGFGPPARPGNVLGGPDDTNPANTNVIAVGGQLLALWEAGSAFALDPETLATKGPVTFRPDLKQMPFLAHPRIEPSGRIWNLGSGGESAFVWRLSATGQFEAGAGVCPPIAGSVPDFTATARPPAILCPPPGQNAPHRP
ncbi:MAG: carotenoid oxygenase family protein, partial [Porphyrobacter sp.]|nr:carotenoid oxygenase family protein [Porphyrobacter sp.]